MIKKILVAMLLAAVMPAVAQNTWEMPEQTADKANPDQKYLAGAVPMVDGRVVFSKVVEAPGKSAKQIYDIVLAYMQKMTKEPNQFEQSRIVLSDPATFKIIGNYQEWLVFKSTALVLDRTRLLYNFMADCEDGRVTLTMTRISYFYDEERLAQTFKAEEWIDDKNGLKKNKAKLSKVSGKFRRKTIDRKDYLFGKIESLLNN